MSLRGPLWRPVVFILVEWFFVGVAAYLEDLAARRTLDWNFRSRWLDLALASATAEREIICRNANRRSGHRPPGGYTL
jgi:hypothetical protein